MNILKNGDKKRRWQDGAFLLLMAAAACFLFWKCRYGISSLDEGLYLTIPYRLMKGDALFLHEWHLSQMSGVLTLPVVWLYVTLNGSTDGIILFMRCFCTAVQCLIAVLMYLRLRRYSYFGAVAASLCFALYIPFGIMALSYNSMGIMGMVLCGVLLLPGKKERKSFYVLAGLCYASAVLCCPHLLFVFILYLAVVAALTVYRRRAQKQQTAALSPWGVKGALLITAGAAGAAVVFGIFVLSRAGLGDMITAFKHIMDDPEHPSLGLFTQAKTYIKGILFATRWNKWLYLLLGLLLAVCVADRKRKDHRELYFWSAAALTLVLMLVHFYYLRYINYVMWSINVMGPFLLLLSKKSTIRQLFTCLWIPGILYSICIHLSSNQIFITSSSASTVATVGSLMMLGVFLEELWEQRQRVSFRTFSACAAGLLALAQLVTLGYMRYHSVFWDTDAGMAGQIHEITQGAQAGLVVSDVRYEYHRASMALLQEVSVYNPDKVLYLTNSTWYYLEGDYEMATYSSWLSGAGEHTLKRLQAYYELNPEKLPDLIFASGEYAETGVKLVRAYGYEETETPGIWVMKK